MIKGKTIFRCTNCHKVFVGIDVELQNDVCLTPIQYLRYGNISVLPIFTSKLVCKRIWQTMSYMNH